MFSIILLEFGFLQGGACFSIINFVTPHVDLNIRPVQNMALYGLMPMLPVDMKLLYREHV